MEVWKSTFITNIKLATCFVALIVVWLQWDLHVLGYSLILEEELSFLFLTISQAKEIINESVAKYLYGHQWKKKI